MGIRANELRIGNYVNDTDHKHIPYFEIEMFYGTTDFKPKLDYEDLTICLSKCESIPLTEEWLLKFGFEKNNHIWFNDTNIGFTFTKKGKIEWNEPKHIKYVHQFQNLYFALTNKELKIKELV